MDYKKIAEWALTGETGSSSEFMAAYLAGFNPSHRGFSHPSDGGDFNRCVGLLKAVPELREHLPKIAAVNPYWKSLVKHWDEIESAPDELKYKIIKNILNPIRERDTNTVSLGEGVSISFGGFKEN